jgi:Ca2+-binding RTX toxin-like protein
MGIYTIRVPLTQTLIGVFNTTFARLPTSQEVAVTNNDGTITVIEGTDLTFDLGVATGGIITGMKRTSADGFIEYEVFSQLGLDNISFASFWNAPTPVDRFDYVFSSRFSVVGSSGNDSLRAGTGGAIIDGQDGDDEINGDVGTDDIDGSLGDDVIYTGGGDGSSSYEVARGSEGNDSISVTTSGTVAGNYRFYGDTTLGLGEGNDILDLSGAGGNIGPNDNWAWGGAGDDFIIDSAFKDHLFGEAGNDIITSGLGGDEITGGDGVDVVSYYGSPDGVTVSLDQDLDNVLVTGIGVGGHADGDTYDTIESVLGSNFGADTLTGNAEDNYLHGLAGDDVIDGGDGNDSLNGGDGIDTLSFASLTNGVQASLGFYTADTGAAYDGTFSDYLVGFENLEGTGFDDILQGNDENNHIYAGLGQDSLYGKLGADTFHFDILEADGIHDFEDGVDKLSFNNPNSEFMINFSSFDDFTIWGNGTSDYMAIEFKLNNTVIVLKGLNGSVVTLDESDFMFTFG